MTETSIIISAFILILVASFAMYTINKNQETVSKQLSDAKVSLEKASHNQVIVQPYDPYQPYYYDIPLYGYYFGGGHHRGRHGSHYGH